MNCFQSLEEMSRLLEAQHLRNRDDCVCIKSSECLCVWKSHECVKLLHVVPRHA